MKSAIALSVVVVLWGATRTVQAGAVSALPSGQAVMLDDKDKGNDKVVVNDKDDKDPKDKDKRSKTKPPKDSPDDHDNGKGNDDKQK